MQIRFDDIPVPAAKLDAVVDENMKEIRKMYKERKRKKAVIRWMSAAAAVAVAAGFCFSNPVLAAKIPLIGHIFEQVQDEQRYPGNFDEVAQPIADNNSCTSQGVTVTLSEIYSSTEAMYVSAMIESEEEFPEKLRNSGQQEGADSDSWLRLEADHEFDFMKAPEKYEPEEWPGEKFEWTPLEVKGKFVDEHTFAGAFRIDYNLYPLEASDVPNTFNWKLKVKSIDNYDNYHKEGEWEFDTDVTVDTSKGEKVVEVNKSAPNGEVITTVTMTDYEVRVDTAFDESEVQPGYESFDSVQYVMLDADGKLIHDKIGMFSPAGYNLSKINVYYFATPAEEEYMAIQEKINDESFAEELQGYLEKIAIQKTVIDLE